MSATNRCFTAEAQERKDEVVSKSVNTVKPRMKGKGNAQDYLKSTRSVKGLISSVCISTSNKVLQNHSDTVLNGFYVMWKQKFLCDVVLKVEDQTFYAHRSLLASCCDYFNDLFSDSDANADEEIEVTLNGINPNTIGLVIECMYTGKIQLNELNVREVLAAAKYMKFYSIEDACSEFLGEHLNKTNCLRMLNLAFTYRLNGLTEKCLKEAAEHFSQLASGIDFLQMESEHVLALLARDEVNVKRGELEIFEAVLAWIKFDKTSRLDYASELFETVRLPLLNPSEIVDHVESVDYLMEDSRCQELVKEALHYHCLPARQSILQSPRTLPRCTSKVECVIAMGGAPRMKNDEVGRDVTYFDPTTKEWNFLTRLNEPRHHHAVATLGGFLYVAGGETTNDQRSPLATAFRYDPRNDTWLKIASMNHSRESFQLGVLAGGRVDQEESLSAVERYNPAVDRWDLVSPISSARRSVAIAAHGGRLYAVGGSGDKRICSKVERYNPLLDEWEQRRMLSTPRFFANLASVRNRLYLIGGATVDQSGSVTCAKSVECYNPLSDSWTTVANMEVPRAEAGCTVLDNKIYIIGGYSWDRLKRLDSVESYDTSKDCWDSETSIDKPYTGVGVCTLTLYKNDVCRSVNDLSLV
ncbi:unnamed protein product [Owenia fusiformis]|uniref:BTB domain-containing protein n=1 Tax=Owenia fusiformis TaxID=6347 RepID=A0A8S4PRQ4_OWEFU|nr:unnamed protein product [Owenia fusiformis]